MDKRMEAGDAYATIPDFERHSFMTDETNPASARIMQALAMAWGMGIMMIGFSLLSKFVGHSHWEYIAWLSTSDNLRSWKYIFDMAANTILFAPFGYFLARSLGTSPARGARIAVGSAASLSSGIEFYHVYCQNRYPSPLDIFANTLGSLIDAAVAVLIDRTRHTPPEDRITPTRPARTLAP
jgi:glycopeptide antibiotics resistance protein